MKERTNDATMALDSTVRSQDSNDSNETKDSSNVGSKPESCMESKHSKEILISEKRQKQQRQRHRQERRDENEGTTKLGNAEARDDSNLLMFASCGQLLLGKFVEDETDGSSRSFFIFIFSTMILFTIVAAARSRLIRSTR